MTKRTCIFLLASAAALTLGGSSNVKSEPASTPSPQTSVAANKPSEDELNGAFNYFISKKDVGAAAKLENCYNAGAASDSNQIFALFQIEATPISLFKAAWKAAPQTAKNSYLLTGKDFIEPSIETTKKLKFLLDSKVEVQDIDGARAFTTIYYQKYARYLKALSEGSTISFLALALAHADLPCSKEIARLQNRKSSLVPQQEKYDRELEEKVWNILNNKDQMRTAWDNLDQRLLQSRQLGSKLNLLLTNDPGVTVPCQAIQSAGNFTPSA